MTAISDAIELYNQGRFQEVEQICSGISPESESYAQAQHLLGVLAYQYGKLTQAEQFLLNAVALRPNEAMFSNHLGSTLCGLGRFEEGIATYRRAIKLNPRLADTHYNLGNALMRKGGLVQAQRCFERALKLDPDYLEAKQNFANLLRDQGHSVKAELLLGKAKQQYPTHIGLASNYLFNLNYHVTDAQRLIDEHRQFATTYAEKAVSPVNRFSNIPSSDRRLSIGYVSADFFRHLVSYFIEPLLRHHHRSDFEVYCYASVPNEDDVTQRLSGLADVWRNIRHLSDDAVAEQVQRDEIDILIDLAGHTSNQRLLVFAQKPAPVQVTYLGYPNTTGLSSIDYRITDIRADPAGNERWHSEALLRLPNGFLCFAAPDEAGDITSPPSLSTGKITFGCFNAMAKIQQERATVTLAQEGLRLAELRFNEGVGIQSETLDAELALTNAQTQLVQALRDYAVANAAIERATGTSWTMDEAAEPVAEPPAE